VLLNDGTTCDDGDDLSINDRCELGSCVADSLTCHSVLNGVVLFGNGCGGLNNTNTRWSFNYLQAACVCTSAQGVAFGDFDARADTPDLCAQMICSGGAFNFQRCDYRGVTVSTARREGTLITVPFEYEDYICGRATPPSVLTVATTIAAQTTPNVLAPTVCGRVHEIAWGFGARDILLSILRGDTVRWVWDGSLPLNVRGTWGALSGSVTYNGSYDVTFNQEGQFTFRSDVVIPEISGAITVSSRTGSIPVTGPVVSVTVSPVDAPTVNVGVGSPVTFVWDGSAAVVVESSACGSMLAGLMFQSGLASVRGSVQVQYQLAGTYRYAIRANGNTIEGIVVVSTLVTTTTLAPSFPTLSNAPTGAPMLPTAASNVITTAHCCRPPKREQPRRFGIC
jgi:plastocyanin